MEKNKQRLITVKPERKGSNQAEEPSVTEIVEWYSDAYDYNARADSLSAKIPVGKQGAVSDLPQVKAHRKNRKAGTPSHAVQGINALLDRMVLTVPNGKKTAKIDLTSIPDFCTFVGDVDKVAHASGFAIQTDATGRYLIGLEKPDDNALAVAHVALKGLWKSGPLPDIVKNIRTEAEKLQDASALKRWIATNYCPIPEPVKEEETVGV